MKKTFCVAAIFCLSLLSGTTKAAEQQYVHMICPEVDTIQFKYVPDKSANDWEHYNVWGFPKILSNNYVSFLMRSWATGNTVKYFSGASYLENSFICNYWDGAHNSFVLDQDDLSGDFKDCRFKNGDPYECDGKNVADCELVCER